MPVTSHLTSPTIARIASGLSRSRNPQFTQDVVTLVDEQNVTSYDHPPVLNDGVTYCHKVE